MSNLAADIKSMKLYSHIDRVYNELRELGKSDTDPLQASELSAFDQLHYHGTDAVDESISMIGINQNARVLEIGSGFGGPSRHVVTKTGASVTALELQEDQDRLAAELTGRCGLADRLQHVCGDFLTYPWQENKFDAIVSWLAIYHIPNRPRLLEISRDLLPSGGAFYTEDLYSRAAFDEAERAELASGLFASHLPDLDTYKSEFEQAGFKLEAVDDMSDDWTQFTTERLAAYRDSRERHIRVHDEPTYLAMESFYALVNRHFRSGKLGGIRLLARKD